MGVYGSKNFLFVKKIRLCRQWHCPCWKAGHTPFLLPNGGTGVSELVTRMCACGTGRCRGQKSQMGGVNGNEAGPKPSETAPVFSFSSLSFCWIGAATSHQQPLPQWEFVYAVGRCLLPPHSSETQGGCGRYRERKADKEGLMARRRRKWPWPCARLSCRVLPRQKF